MEKIQQMFESALLIAGPIYKENKEIWEKWNLFYEDVMEDSSRSFTSPNSSAAFLALVTWLGKKELEGISTVKVAMNLEAYRDEIHNTLSNIIMAEFSAVEITKDELHKDDSKYLDKESNDGYYEVNNSAVYYQLRDSIAKNQFEEDDASGKMTYPIQTKDGSGLAQLSSHHDDDLRLTRHDELSRWHGLVSDVMSNMDDLTADCLDVITIKWLQQAKSPEAFIDFSYEQVLEMCNMPKKKKDNYEFYGAEDKIKVAKRIAAIASIFIYLNDNNEVVVWNEDNEANDLEIKREEIKRLFVLDSVVLWRNNKTNEYLGIESCRIKPGSFLSQYLFGSGATSALLSQKALEYNSYRHKYHKRLIRYLTWQWRIRQVASNIRRPYSIGGDKGLLSVMGIPSHWKPGRIREHIENILTDLENEKVIYSWSYSEMLDEEKLSKRNWFREYWLLLGIVIIPPEELLKSQYGLTKRKNSVDVLDVIEIQDDTVSKVDHTEDSIRKQILKIHQEDKVSIRELAKAIGISAPTLSRFCNKQTKKLSSAAKKKLLKWYERQIIIEKM